MFSLSCQSNYNQFIRSTDQFGKQRTWRIFNCHLISFSLVYSFFFNIDLDRCTRSLEKVMFKELDDMELTEKLVERNIGLLLLIQVRTTTLNSL